MPIPDRFKLCPASEDVVRSMCDLCDAIESASADSDELAELLRQWHEYATRTFEHVEFRSYSGAVDQETFVRNAINPTPNRVDDVTFTEALAVIATVVDAEAEEHELDYYMTWLEAQFPGANISDLIYWPDEWFDDSFLFRDENGAFKPESELSNEQLLAYAMARSGRTLQGTPELSLPFPIPATR